MSYTKYALTAAGESYVSNNWGKASINLETLKEEIRII